MISSNRARGLHPEDGQLSGTNRVFAQIIENRHTCRHFRPDPVPDTVTEQILRLSQRAPSWCNSQPWNLVITSGKATDRFRDAYYPLASEQEPAPDFAFPAEYVGVYQDRRRECGWQLYESVGIPRSDRERGRIQTMENYRFFDAPHVAIVTTNRSLGVYGAIDCGVYAAHFMLAAQSLGVATAPQAALATHPDFVRKHFGLSEDRLVVCGIAFGYADTDHPVNKFQTSRASLDDVVSYVRD